MNPTNQTRYGGVDGNCMAACIASILEVPIERVDFTATGGDWLKKCQDVLNPLGFFYLGITRQEGVPMSMMVVPDAFCVFVGPTERNKDTNLLHCVVGRVVFRGEMQSPEHPIVHFETVHDPNDKHPDGLLNGMPTEIGYLVPLHPEKFV